MPNTTQLRERITRHRRGLVFLAQLPRNAAGKWDNRPSWDNQGSKFDNRPNWDNWSKR